MTTLRRDPSDLRDQLYEPSLRLLAPEASPGDFVSKSCPAEGCRPYPMRQQGRNGYCVGYALANLIDIHRIRTHVPDAGSKGVSPRMIYEMARQIEGRGPDTPDGIGSLRSAIKAFYHYGCCPDAVWPDEDTPDALPDGPRHIERLRQAHGVTLGAYYRVRPFLNDYHNALMDADGIVVSTEIHDGWYSPEARGTHPDKKTHGRIPLSHNSRGAHAFVILGYNAEGFLILNSFEKTWGGYRGYPAVALWTYADWARNVMDAWVLRLGVPAPDAFLFSVGDQGINLGTSDIRAGSTARHQLDQHFAHLDDGVHVQHGSYASSRASVKAVTEMLANEQPQERRSVLLTVGGSLLGMKDAFDFEARRRQGAEQIPGLYPFALLWCNDLIESAVPVLGHLFQTAVSRVGPHSSQLNAEIEKTTAGIGRAFWREVKRAARKAGIHGQEDGDGAAAEMFDRFAATGAPLHLQLEGVGCNLLARYLLSLRDPTVSAAERQRRDALSERFYDAVASINLIAPTMEREKFVRAFGGPNGTDGLIAKVAAKGPGRVNLWVPSKSLEDRLAVDHYDGSMLELVLRSFEGKTGKDRFYVGMSRSRSGIGRWKAHEPALAGMAVRDIEPQIKGRRRYEYHEVSLNKECHAEILKGIGTIISGTSRT